MRKKFSESLINCGDFLTIRVTRSENFTLQSLHPIPLCPYLSCHIPSLPVIVYLLFSLLLNIASSSSLSSYDISSWLLLPRYVSAFSFLSQSVFTFSPLLYSTSCFSHVLSLPFPFCHITFLLLSLYHILSLPFPFYRILSPPRLFCCVVSLRFLSRHILCLHLILCLFFVFC